MFTLARIKLTAFYIITLGLIIGIFSLFLFHYTTQHIRDSLEENSPNQALEQRIAERTIDDLQNTLIVSDLSIIFLVGFLSYFLAGRTLRPIKASHEAQTQFSANASHELRTPLSIMKAENEVFLRDPNNVSSEAITLAKSNLEEIGRMKVMVENLLLLARSKKASIQTKYQKVNMTNLIQSIISRQKNYSHTKKLEIIFNHLEPTYVIGNKEMLEQLFGNIIQNAFTYTQTGSIRIIIDTYNHTTITIKDTGVGISKNDLPHIQEAFYKANSSKGVGLGLSIAYEIIKIHKGEIQIESEINSGTTVIVTLPSYNKSTI